MTPAGPLSIVVAGRPLRLPPGMTAHLLSDRTAASRVDAFVTASPDHTVYHRAPYIDFAKRQNGAADLVLLAMSGEPQVAIPFHPLPGRVTTGYAGVCLPPTTSETSLRRAVRCLADFARANPQLRLQSLQCAQAPAADDTKRQGLLASIIDSLGPRRQRLYTRLLRLHEVEVSDRTSSTEPTGGAHEQLLRGYDGDLRNQIRQASRRQVTARIVTPRNDAEALEVYTTYLPIHQASWRRTGLAPHGIDYLLGLESAVRQGGGIDVVVIGYSGQGQAVAAVTCHVYRNRAIYWSGCSLEEALPLRANPFCLDMAIWATQQRGVSTFELGRYDAREHDAKELSVTRYKAQFGGDIQPVLNFELGAPRIDARDVGRAIRGRLRNWKRFQKAAARRAG
jgi:Acetyltransferase (GNAT) domain